MGLLFYVQEENQKKANNLVISFLENSFISENKKAAAR